MTALGVSFDSRDDAVRYLKFLRGKMEEWERGLDPRGPDPRANFVIVKLSELKAERERLDAAIERLTNE